MKKNYFISLVLAIFLGVFSQDLAYFLNDLVPSIGPIYFLSLVIFLVYLLFFINLYLVFRKNIFRRNFLFKLLSLVFSIPLLLFNFIVFVAWWG